MHFKPCNSWIFFKSRSESYKLEAGYTLWPLITQHHIHGRSRAWEKQWHVKNCAQKKTWKAVSTFKKHGVDRGSNVLQAVQDGCSSQWPQPSLPETLFLKCSGDRRSANGSHRLAVDPTEAPRLFGSSAVSHHWNELPSGPKVPKQNICNRAM